MTKEEKEAAAAAKQEEKEAAAAANDNATETIGGVEVGDPQLLRPTELPLVIKPAKGGEWKNDEQSQFAAFLNAYAYKNPKKWADKKLDKTVGGKVIKGLITQLIELGDHPELLNQYRGVGPDQTGKISYSDKRINR